MTSDNDIVRRGYLNVVRNPQGGVVSGLRLNPPSGLRAVGWHGIKSEKHGSEQ